MPRHGKDLLLRRRRRPNVFRRATRAAYLNLRAQEAVATVAKTLATACPFCLNMMSDGMAGTGGGEDVKVLDIAELLLSRQKPG